MQGNACRRNARHRGATRLAIIISPNNNLTIVPTLIEIILPLYRREFFHYNSRMVSERDGFHNLNTQIPESVWEALVADADATGESIAKVVTRKLAAAYKIPDSKIPKPRRAGRKPKKR